MFSAGAACCKGYDACAPKCEGLAAIGGDKTALEPADFIRYIKCSSCSVVESPDSADNVMPPTTRSYFVLATGLGAGLLVGSGVALLYYRLRCVSRELRRLVAAVTTLREEVADLKTQLRRRRRPRSGYSTIGPSSGDDDEDIFQDAIGG